MDFTQSLWYRDTDRSWFENPIFDKKDKIYCIYPHNVMIVKVTMDPESLLQWNKISESKLQKVHSSHPGRQEAQSIDFSTETLPLVPDLF
jgi:hypothetical protein